MNLQIVIAVIWSWVNDLDEFPFPPGGDEEPRSVAWRHYAAALDRFAVLAEANGLSFDPILQLRRERGSPRETMNLALDVLEALHVKEQAGTLVDPAKSGPYWDAERGDLIIDGDVIKTIKADAKNVRRVLDAFQEEKWRETIDDPLPGGKNAGRVKETCRSLNEGLFRMRFLRKKRGEAFGWQRVPDNSPRTPPALHSTSPASIG